MDPMEDCVYYAVHDAAYAAAVPHRDMAHDYASRSWSEYELVQGAADDLSEGGEDQ